MRWRLDDVSAFLDVMETGSVTAAARRMNLSKSVVSKRIADLEADLGVTLLHRSTRRIAPTEQGAALYERMRGLVRQLGQAVEDVIADDRRIGGVLRITAPMSFGTLHLAPVLLGFAARHPALEMAIDLDDRMLDLVGGGYDLAIRIGRLADSSLVGRKLCVSRRVVCGSPDYLRRHGAPERIDELTRYECIDYANVTTARLWQFTPAHGSPHGPGPVPIRGRIRVNNGEAMRDAAIAGLGLAILPRFIAADALRDGRLVAVLPDAEPVPDDISAVYPPMPHIPPKLRAVIDHLVGAFGHSPPWETDG